VLLALDKEILAVAYEFLERCLIDRSQRVGGCSEARAPA
jgi:hypothetical protein